MVLDNWYHIVLYNEYYNVRIMFVLLKFHIELIERELRTFSSFMYLFVFFVCIVVLLETIILSRVTVLSFQ